jgi:hypothetical protein
MLKAHGETGVDCGVEYITDIEDKDVIFVNTAVNTSFTMCFEHTILTMNRKYKPYN